MAEFQHITDPKERAFGARGLIESLLASSPEAASAFATVRAEFDALDNIVNTPERRISRDQLRAFLGNVTTFVTNRLTQIAIECSTPQTFAAAVRHDVRPIGRLCDSFVKDQQSLGYRVWDLDYSACARELALVLSKPCKFDSLTFARGVVAALAARREPVLIQPATGESFPIGLVRDREDLHRCVEDAVHVNSEAPPVPRSMLPPLQLRNVHDALVEERRRELERDTRTFSSEAASHLPPIPVDAELVLSHLVDPREVMRQAAGAGGARVPFERRAALGAVLAPAVLERQAFGTVADLIQHAEARCAASIARKRAVAAPIAAASRAGQDRSAEEIALAQYCLRCIGLHREWIASRVSSLLKIP